jgi:peptidyl-prolyl cis-trans isomerase SurA
MSRPVCAELVDRIMAVVNDEIILLSDLEQAMQPWRKKLEQEGYSEVQQRILLSDQQPQILDQLINEKLTDQQISHYNLSVSDAEVDATIGRIMEANRLDRDSLQRLLEMDGLTYEKYREQIKNQILRTKLVNIEVKSKIVVTDEDVREYYDAHSELYGGTTEYHLKHILIRVVPGASESQKQLAREQLAGIHERIRNGEPFDEMARTYSQAPTAPMGGDLGSFEVRLLAEPIRQALQGMQPGEITPVVETEQGLQIFLLEDISQKGGKPFNDVKSEIQEKLYAEIVDQKFQSWLKDLRQNSHIKILE